MCRQRTEPGDRNRKEIKQNSQLKRNTRSNSDLIGNLSRCIKHDVRKTTVLSVQETDTAYRRVVKSKSTKRKKTAEGPRGLQGRLIKLLPAIAGVDFYKSEKSIFSICLLLKPLLIRAKFEPSAEGFTLLNSKIPKVFSIDKPSPKISKDSPSAP